MSQEVKAPTYHRLLSTFKAIGPYLREEQCDADAFFFDCLAVCVNDKKSPDEREFWGWWMVLSTEEGGYMASYKYGRYDAIGQWQEEAVGAKNVDEVERTRTVFHEKLVKELRERFGMSLSLEESDVVCS